MNNKTLLTILGAIFVVVGVIFLFTHDKALGAQPSTAITEVANTVLPNGVLLPNPSTYDYLVSRVYLAIQSAYGLGDGTSVPVHIQAVRQATVAATTTPCSVQNPFNATSTFQTASINITTATSAATILTIATSSVPNAAASTVFGINIPANATTTTGMEGVASSTGQMVVVAPNGYVNFNTAAATTWGGTCTVLFQTIN